MMHAQTILVAEDEASLCSLIGAAFDGQPYHLVFAADGPEALSQAQAVRPDLMILDIVLPKSSGTEVCRTVKADPATRQAKVVFISAYPEREQQAREAGGDAFLAKPYSPLWLVHTVETLLAPASTPGRDGRRTGCICRLPRVETGE